MCGRTIVYYTSNGDYPALENAVRDTIREHSQGLPIVSVSQQPIDFGDNICVGDIGRSRHNIYRQLRIGAEAAKTQHLVVCEADFLYPPEWFQFSPPRDDRYYYPEVCYIIWRKFPVFYRKKMRQLTGIVGRDHLLRILDTIEEFDRPESECDPFMRGYMPSKVTQYEEFDAGPVVTLKTDRQMHGKSPHSKSDRAECLPIWGTARDVWEKFACDE